MGTGYNLSTAVGEIYEHVLCPVISIISTSLDYKLNQIQYCFLFFTPISSLFGR